MHVFDYYKIPLFRKNVCIVGRGLLVGQPLSALLLKRMSNIVILDENNKDNLEYYIQNVKNNKYRFIINKNTSLFIIKK